jgi:nicotinamidase-related amidase
VASKTPTALLIMDVQQSIVERFTRDGGYLDRLASAIAAARSAGVGVTYVTVAFRPGYPEVSERNKSFSAIAGTGRFTDGDPGMQIPAVVAPAPGEVTVTKRRVSAFTGSDLEVLLRARGTGHLGRRCGLRACLSNFRTTRSDIDLIVARVAEIARGCQRGV